MDCLKCQKPYTGIEYRRQYDPPQLGNNWEEHSVLLQMYREACPFVVTVFHGSNDDSWSKNNKSTPPDTCYLGVMDREEISSLL